MLNIFANTQQADYKNAEALKRISLFFKRVVLL